MLLTDLWPRGAMAGFTRTRLTVTIDLFLGVTAGLRLGLLRDADVGLGRVNQYTYPRRVDRVINYRASMYVY